MQGFAEALKNGKYTNDEAIKVITGVLVLKVPSIIQKLKNFRF